MSKMNGTIGKVYIISIQAKRCKRFDSWWLDNAISTPPIYNNIFISITIPVSLISA